MPLRLLCALIVANLPAFVAQADMPDSRETRKAVANEHFEAGMVAFEREDWPLVIDEMKKVLAQLPRHSDAHSLTGYALRQLGDFEGSLEHYDKALAINPTNLGALEYLGEAYLELGRTDDAEALLVRLGEACLRVEPVRSPQDCEEWQDLDAAIRSHRSEDTAA